VSATARRDELVALLSERGPAAAGLTSAEATRRRGFVLASFGEVGLPDEAVPYVREALESGIEPYELAGAAIALRGAPPDPAFVPLVERAIRSRGGADATLSFEAPDARWPYAEPTSCLAELERTLAWLQAAPAGHCCHATEPAPPDGDLALDDVVLQDQDGRSARFADWFGGRPAVVAFFYTRCDNPNKCSLTIARLAQLQALAAERGLRGAFRIAAITYDPAFDLPDRLRRYGADRGLVFDADTCCLRATDGFERLRDQLELGVAYGPSTVSRHRIELYVLDAGGRVATAITRRQWQPVEALAAVEPLL
jgi:protein SCO1/2